MCGLIVVLVWVCLLRELVECAPDLLCACVLGYAQVRVVVYTARGLKFYAHLVYFFGLCFSGSKEFCLYGQAERS